MKTTILILSIILLFSSNFVLAKTINGKPRIIDGDTIHIKSNKIITSVMYTETVIKKESNNNK